MITRTLIKTGALCRNHNQAQRRHLALRVGTGVKAGGVDFNHNQRSLRIKTGVKAGAMSMNHNRRHLRVKTGLKAGWMADGGIGSDG